jgi:intracellular multiplication protein IcmV
MIEYVEDGMGMISGFKNMMANAIGYQRIRQQTRDLKAVAVDMVTPEKSARRETFEEALVRLNLSEEDIQRRTKEFNGLLLVFRIIATVLAIYFIYALWHRYFIASLGTLGILLVVSGQMFRYHFWLFQIRSRRLGCTFKEWFYDLAGKKV